MQRGVRINSEMKTGNENGLLLFFFAYIFTALKLWRGAMALPSCTVNQLIIMTDVDGHSKNVDGMI